MLAIPGMERLRDDTITFASVASQPRYTLPQNVARIKAITDRANMRRIQFLSLDQLRSLDPGQTAERVVGLVYAHRLSGRRQATSGGDRAVGGEHVGGGYHADRVHGNRAHRGISVFRRRPR